MESYCRYNTITRTGYSKAKSFLSMTSQMLNAVNVQHHMRKNSKFTQPYVQTNSNALMYITQFVCTHRCIYETICLKNNDPMLKKQTLCYAEMVMTKRNIACLCEQIDVVTCMYAFCN